VPGESPLLLSLHTFFAADLVAPTAGAVSPPNVVPTDAIEAQYIQTLRDLNDQLGFSKFKIKTVKNPVRACKYVRKMCNKEQRGNNLPPIGFASPLVPYSYP